MLVCAAHPNIAGDESPVPSLLIGKKNREDLDPLGRVQDRHDVQTLHEIDLVALT